MNTPTKFQTSQLKRGIVSALKWFLGEGDFPWRQGWVRYAIALVTILAAVTLRAALDPIIGPNIPYLTIYPTMMIVAVMLGSGPGVFATGVGLVLTEYYFVPPEGIQLNVSFAIRAVILFMASLYVGRIAQALRNARAQAQAEATMARTAEACLREGEEWLVLAQRAGHIGVFDWNLTTNAVVWTPEVEEIFGLAPGQFEGTYQGWSRRVQPGDQKRMEQFFTQWLEFGREEEQWEYRGMRPDGTTRWIGARARIVRDDHARPLRLIGTHIDITERRKREDELCRLNRTLRALSNSNQALMRAGEESEFTAEVCQIIVRDCGHSMVWIGFAGEDEAKTVRPVAYAGFEEGYLETLRITWADTERGRGPTGTAIRTGKPCRCTNLQTDSRFAPWRDEAIRRGYASSLALPLLADGTTFGALTIYSQQPDPFSEDEVKLLSELSNDMANGIMSIRLHQSQQRAEAALRQTAQELERSNRDLEQFAYVASHDLQEPLRAVSGYVELLRHRFPERLDDKAKEYVAGAVDGAGRMQRLIGDLLAFARVSTRGGAFANADLNAVLDAALANLQISLKEARARVTREPLPTLRVDAGQIVQLFQNLIGNSVKFHSERAPEIHVGVRSEKDGWLFWVRDNGIGIEPEYFDRIFQIFQRLHTRKHYPGTGMGLAICKRIVERHGGAIWLESQPGQGSTFHFSIPETSARKESSA